MNNHIKKKNIILIVLVLLIGIVIVGGTYAYLSVTVNVTNGTYNTKTTCFNIDYTDNTNLITGTMFPSTGPSGGLSGSVSIKVNDSCSVTGTGTLYLSVDNNTSAKFGDSVSSHCENLITYETMNDYTTSSTCTSAGGIWVNGSALKYIIFDNDSFSGNPLAVGKFYADIIGQRAPILDNFTIDHTEKTYYIYVWLDGYISNNTYTNLTFSGKIIAEATQNG